MTTENITTTGETQNGSNKPHFRAKIRQAGFGKKAYHETIGAGWKQEDGSIFVKLAGTQVIDRGFRLYPVEDNDMGAEQQLQED